MTTGSSNGGRHRSRRRAQPVAGVDPVGRTTRIGAEFEVIGVAEPRGIDPLASDLDDFVAIPFQTAIRRVTI